MNQIRITLNLQYTIVVRFLLIVFCCLTLFTFAQPSIALTIQDVPNPRQINGSWIVDLSNKNRKNNFITKSKILFFLLQQIARHIKLKIYGF